MSEFPFRTPKKEKPPRKGTGHVSGRMGRQRDAHICEGYEIFCNVILQDLKKDIKFVNEYRADTPKFTRRCKNLHVRILALLVYWYPDDKEFAEVFEFLKTNKRAYKLKGKLAMRGKPSVIDLFIETARRWALNRF